MHLGNSVFASEKFLAESRDISSIERGAADLDLRSSTTYGDKRRDNGERRSELHNEDLALVCLCPTPVLMVENTPGPGQGYLIPRYAGIVLITEKALILTQS